jgi:hypothetical protein
MSQITLPVFQIYYTLIPMKHFNASLANVRAYLSIGFKPKTSKLYCRQGEICSCTQVIWRKLMRWIK